MKKILVITNMYPSKKYPHYGIFIENTVKLLRENGFKVNVVSMPKHDFVLLKALDYVLFYGLAILRGIFGNYDYLYGHYISHIATPIKVIHKIKPKIKIILNVHGNDVVIEEDWMYKNEIRSASILPLATKVVAPSKYFKKQLMSLYNVPEDKIVLYPSGGINLKTFYKRDETQAKKDLGLDINTKYIGYVSRVEAHKGWETFVNMAKIMIENGDQRKFILVGSGDQDNELNDLIQKNHLEDKIIRFPLIDQNKLADVYSCLEYFIFPTYRKSESLGLVGLEAMACECLCIIANNYGPTSYLLDGENGYFFESKSVLNLVHRIESIDKLSKEHKDSIRKAAYKTANQYDVNVTANQILEVFK